MAAKMSVLPNYPKNVAFPSPQYLRSRFLVLACLQKTSFACSWRVYPRLCFFHVAPPSSIKSSKRISWSLRSSIDGGGLDSPPGSSNNGETRLVRAIQAFQIKLSRRIKELKRGFPMKVLFFLVGFYCATAFATVIGQTGDWDILSAGLAVFVVEGIGALMYSWIINKDLHQRLGFILMGISDWKYHLGSASASGRQASSRALLGRAVSWPLKVTFSTRLSVAVMMGIQVPSVRKNTPLGGVFPVETEPIFAI
ncbi:Uncharacterized protein family Ycf20 [Macleaya cordata]|uniref:Uncharacterized protein family Ycf20 n=1 Tax=Macleaya cordata TaxID=56857 RepID=A0A200R9Z9_MACCD|nr:Uncharacterized protein family Ycf20 [Macleaya cordata]